MLSGFMRVRCAMCDRQVDEIVHRVDMATWTNVVEARCHGEIDVCTIDLREMDPRSVLIEAESVAFDQPRMIA